MLLSKAKAHSKCFDHYVHCETYTGIDMLGADSARCLTDIEVIVSSLTTGIRCLAYVSMAALGREAQQNLTSKNIMFTGVFYADSQQQ